MPGWNRNMSATDLVDENQSLMWLVTWWLRVWGCFASYWTFAFLPWVKCCHPVAYSWHEWNASIAAGRDGRELRQQLSSVQTFVDWLPHSVGSGSKHSHCFYISGWSSTQLDLYPPLRVRGPFPFGSHFWLPHGHSALSFGLPANQTNSMTNLRQRADRDAFTRPGDPWVFF